MTTPETNTESVGANQPEIHRLTKSLDDACDQIDALYELDRPEEATSTLVAKKYQLIEQIDRLKRQDAEAKSHLSRYPRG